MHTVKHRGKDGGKDALPDLIKNLQEVILYMNYFSFITKLLLVIFIRTSTFLQKKYKKSIDKYKNIIKKLN